MLVNVTGNETFIPRKREIFANVPNCYSTQLSEKVAIKFAEIKI